MCIRDTLRMFQQRYEQIIAKRNLYGFSFLYFKAMHKLRKQQPIEENVVAEVLAEWEKEN